MSLSEASVRIGLASRGLALGQVAASAELSERSSVRNLRPPRVSEVRSRQSLVPPQLETASDEIRQSRKRLLVEILAILVVLARHERRRHLRELARVDLHERSDPTELAGGIGAEILICQLVQIDTLHERSPPFQSLDFQDVRLPVQGKLVDQGVERPPNTT